MTWFENLHRNIKILFFIHVPLLNYTALLKATGEAAKRVCISSSNVIRELETIIKKLFSKLMKII